MSSTFITTCFMMETDFRGGGGIEGLARCLNNGSKDRRKDPEQCVLSFCENSIFSHAVFSEKLSLFHCLAI